MKWYIILNWFKNSWSFHTGLNRSPLSTNRPCRIGRNKIGLLRASHRGLVELKVTGTMLIFKFNRFLVVTRSICTKIGLLAQAAGVLIYACTSLSFFCCGVNSLGPNLGLWIHHNAYMITKHAPPILHQGPHFCLCSCPFC